MSLFEQEEAGSLFGEEEKPVVEVAPSDRAVAAQVATLSDEDTYQAYSNIMAQEANQRAETLKNQSTLLSMQDQLGYKTDALKMLASNELTPEVSEVVAGQLQQDLPPRKSSVRFVEKMLTLPSGDETPQEEEVRISNADVVDYIVSNIERKQQYMNAEEFNEGDMKDLFLDFLEYLVPFDESAFAVEVIGKINAGEVTGPLEAVVALGNSKMDLQKMYYNMSDEQRVEFEKLLFKAVTTSTGIVFTNDNDLMQRDFLMSVIDGSTYGGGLQTLDTIISIIDMVGLGLLFKRPLQLVGKAVAGGTAAAISSVDIAAVKNSLRRSRVQAASPARMAEQANPEEVRNMREAAMADETGETAAATHGTGVDEVVVDTFAPQIRGADGSVEASVHTPMGPPAPAWHIPGQVRHHLTEDFLKYSPEEITSAMINESARFHKVGALHRHDLDGAHSLEFHDLSTGSVELSNVYGLKDTGFSSADEAIEAVSHEFRFYDVSPEDMELLRRTAGGRYEPTTLAEVQAKQALRDEFVRKKKKLPPELKKENLLDDYVVRVNFKRDFNPTSVTHEPLSYTRNWLDRIPFLAANKQGSASLTRYLFDPASIFDTRIFKSAAVAVERASAIDVELLRLADRFIKPVKELDKDKKEILFQMLKEQNLLGRRYTRGEIQAKGLDPQIFDAWADTWDVVYSLENRDRALTLRNQGYGQVVVRDADGVESTFFGKPIKQRGSVGDKVKVVDPETGIVRTMSKNELDELYDSGGRVQRLKTPHVAGDKSAEFTFTRETDGSYLKEIKENDKVLNYRDGYYAVRYEDPFFITKVVDGVRTVVKTAPTVKALEREMKALEEAEAARVADGGEGTVTYSYRENRDLNNVESEDYAWSLMANQGRTAQKLRGERIGSTDNAQLGVVQDPMDSMIASMRSISARTSSRDWITKMKIRFMDEFKDFLPTENGMPVMPRNGSDLTIREGTQHDKRLADARSFLEYINYMEHGYRNSLDEGWKAILNMMAETIGAKSEKAERFVRGVSSDINSPTGFMRGRAFDLYLATNPLRQFVIQAHQGSLLAVNFPEYVLSQKMARDMTAIHAAIVFGDKLKDVPGMEKLMGMTADQAHALRLEFENTGFMASIDRQNLVEGGLNSLVEQQNFKKTKQLHKATVGKLREVGFDAGERINMMSAWLAYRDRALKDGADVTNLTTQARIIADARNYTFNMNAAGDMPYNKTALSLIFQFMQVPHKAMLTVTTNRGLSAGEKARLATYNLLALSLPSALIIDMFGEDGLPEDPTYRDLAINGVEGAMLNKAAQLMFGDDTQLDYSSLSAFDPYGLYELLVGLVSMDAGEILSSAPSMSLLMGNSPRIAHFVDEARMLMSEPSQENLATSIKTFLGMSSGFTNLSKAYRELYVHEVNERISNGMITDPSLSIGDSVGKAFGFPTLTEKTNWVLKKKLYKESKQAIDDAKEFARLQHQFITRRGLDVRDPEYALKMSEALEATRAFFVVNKFTEKQKMAYLNEIGKYVRKGDDTLFKAIMASMNLRPTEEVIGLLRTAGYKEAADSVEKITNDINSEKGLE